MELRVLEYFLAITEEGTVSGAAKKLHVTQPTLSRQIRELEEELGTQLFIREPRCVRLTPAGELLRDRARQMVEIAHHIQTDITSDANAITGDVYIGAGETDAMSVVAHALLALQAENPDVRFHIFSGNAETLTERLDAGLLDFALLIGDADMRGYAHLTLPSDDKWGLLMRKDHALAGRSSIGPKDLRGVSLLCSSQALRNKSLSGWLSWSAEGPRIVGTYNLVFNARVMVETGLGTALAISGVSRTHEESDLVFVPLHPDLPAPLTLAWDSRRRLSAAAVLFLNKMQTTLS